MTGDCLDLKRSGARGIDGEGEEESPAPSGRRRGGFLKGAQGDSIQ